MTVASLVLGIIALVFGLLIEALVGIVCGILLIIFGAFSANTNPDRRTMSNAGGGRLWNYKRNNMRNLRLLLL